MNRQNFIFSLILLIICFLIYYSTIDTFFTGEDFDNIGYQSISRIIRNFIFKPEQNIGHFTRGIPNTFWAIQYFLFGKNYICYHVVNILLHWFCSFLVFKLAMKMLDQHDHKRLISYGAGILFAVLPVHAIVVNWLTLLFEKFCTIFFISGFITWIRFKEGKEGRFYFFALALFIFAILSKEEAITFPIIIYVYDKIFFWRKERSWRNIFDSWKIYLPSLAIAIAYFPYRIYRFSGIADINQHTAMKANLIQNLGAILKMMSQPLPYLLIIIFFVVGLFLKNRIFYFMTIWMAVVLIPVYHIPKEWRLYLASVGFCIAFSVNLYDVINRCSKHKKAYPIIIFLVSIILLLMIYGVQVDKINQHWKSVTDLSKNLYSKFKKEFPDIPDRTKIYFAGLDSANDVCSSALFDTVVKFMYEKHVNIRNFEEFFLDLSESKGLDSEMIWLLEYKNGEIKIRADWKTKLLNQRWLSAIYNQQNVIYRIEEVNLQNISKDNPHLSFMIKDNCCILFTNKAFIEVYFRFGELKSTYINSVIIRMKVLQVYTNYSDFFWETKEGKMGRTKFSIEKSEEFKEYIIPLGNREDWFMQDSISGFGLVIPAKSFELCIIKFSRLLPLEGSEEESNEKLDSLQPIPAFRK